jgi:[protein-PII] uridylyltransferase
MVTILDKLESGAEKNLTLVPGRLPAEDLACFKTFLKVETHRLKIRHRAGAGGREVAQGRAAVMDTILRYMWTAIKLSFSQQSQREFPPLALVALGGYGRAELNPCSDIDMMFLHEGQVVGGSRALPFLARLTDGIIHPLWDLGLKLGHSVRTVEECVFTANQDMQSKTSLIQARLVVGDEELFAKLQKTVIKKCVEGHEDQYVSERLEDQKQRHSKYGESPCMQEPNIKNGCGGLRDFQNLEWMAYFKYRTKTLGEMQQRELISAQECRRLETAYDFLLRVRNELHYLVNRPVDMMTKNLQPTLASNLGYTDRSPSLRLEKFMREYYTLSRNIYLINRMLEERLALQPAPKRLQFIRRFIRARKPVEQEPVDGFRFTETHIVAASPRVFRDQPRRLMRVFLYAQQRGLRLHPDLWQMIHNQLDLADRSFLTDEHVRETFLAILNQRGNVAPVLRTMHEVGLLGKYIPEFGRLTCLVQHEFYHRYTADEHTLVCLEKLDRVWEAREKPYSEYSEIFQKLERPYLLYLALLLHDTGKVGSEGNHSLTSGKYALRVAQRLGLDGSATHALRLVIENHLAMVVVSQRQDMGDPGVIRSFANQIQNAETLVLLTLHTLADSMATSAELWNDFKDSLLWTLHRKTMADLGGSTESIRAEALQRELLEEEVARLTPAGVSPEEIKAHFAKLPARYLEIHSAQEITRDLMLTHHFMKMQFSEDGHPLAPVVDWHNEPDRGYSVVKVCTWDRNGLFYQIAGCLSAAGMNILSAQIFTRQDDIALDTFYVTEARSVKLVAKELKDKFEVLLTKCLTSGQVDLTALVARKKDSPLPYQTYEGDRLPTSIRFDNKTTPDRTALEVQTEDRVGLLYTISKSLAELGMNISAAKIVTEKGAAIDTFYVTERDGSQILDAGRQEFAERKIRDSINRLG